jgi:CBS domain containing-hemolysin-like protein
VSDVPIKPKRRGLIARLKQRLSGEKDASLRESLESAIESHGAQNPGEIKDEAKSMMLNLIAFADMRVDDVMLPRADIVAIEEGASLRELLDRFVEANHSRLPVYRETLDGMTGMVHIKDLVRWMTERGLVKRKRRTPKGEAAAPAMTLSAVDLATQVKDAGLTRELLFVPPSMPAPDLLVKMQATHAHMAIVVDEYGGTDGVLTIEDLVEEIVGDISDEHDDDAKLVAETGAGVYVADARADLEDLEELFGVDLGADDDEEADTLGGLIFTMLGRVPVRGELVRHESGLEFEILEADPRRAKRVKIRTRPAEPPPAG